MKALLVISANNTSSKHRISEHIKEQAISIYFPSPNHVLEKKKKKKNHNFNGVNILKKSNQIRILETFVLVSEAKPVISIVFFTTLTNGVF